MSVAVGAATLALVGCSWRSSSAASTGEAASTPALAADEHTGPVAYLRLVGATWLRLALLAALMFTAQENLEAVAAGLPIRGLDVILGHGLLPLLVILATTLLMALAVALVRWRRRVLLGRLAAAARAWSRARSPSRHGGPDPLLGFRPADTWGSRAPPKVATTIAP